MRKDRVNFTLSKEGQTALSTAAKFHGLSMSAWIEMTARQAAAQVAKETSENKARAS